MVNYIHNQERDYYRVDDTMQANVDCHHMLIQEELIL